MCLFRLNELIGTSSVSSLQTEFQDQTEVSINQMQMLWSLFSQIQQNSNKLLLR